MWTRILNIFARHCKEKDSRYFRAGGVVTNFRRKRIAHINPVLNAWTYSNISKMLTIILKRTGHTPLCVGDLTNDPVSGLMRPAACRHWHCCCLNGQFAAWLHNLHIRWGKHPLERWICWTGLNEDMQRDAFSAKWTFFILQCQTRC